MTVVTIVVVLIVVNFSSLAVMMVAAWCLCFWGSRYQLMLLHMPLFLYAMHNTAGTSSSLAAQIRAGTFSSLAVITVAA